MVISSFRGTHLESGTSAIVSQDEVFEDDRFSVG